jgi:hemerythrin
MAFREWSPANSATAPRINHHHRRLLAIAEELQEAQRTGQRKNVLAAALEHLTNFVIAHFYVEEEMLKRLNYPRLGEHMVQHRRLILQLEDLSGKFKENQAALTSEATDVIRTGLEDHILQTHGRESESTDSLPLQSQTPQPALQTAGL